MSELLFLGKSGHALVLSMVSGIPLACGLACVWPRLRPLLFRFLPWVTLPALFVALFMPPDIAVRVAWFFMGGLMGLDQLGRVLLLVCGFIWLLASFRARGRARADHRGQGLFVACFLVAMAGNFGLLLARDMLGYYLFFAMMSLAAYGLVVHKGTIAARRAGRLYIIMVLIGEVAMFAALALIFQQTNSLLVEDIRKLVFSPVLFGLLFIGFGVKIGALPLHLWMAPAYRHTPAPAAAPLAGAMVNGGILGWVRFMPLGQTAWPAATFFLVGIGSLAALYGVIRGLAEPGKKAVLAWSSISQMGLMTVVVGLGLLTPEIGDQTIPVLALFMVHHALAKASLFFGYESSRKQALNIWRLAGLLLPGLALAGLPMTSGAIAKTGCKELFLVAGGQWARFGGWFLPLSSMATTVLMLHFVLLFKDGGRGAGERKSPRSVWLVSLLAVAATLWLWPAAREAAGHSLAAVKIWQGFWPVAAGGLLTLARNYFMPLNRFRRPTSRDPVAFVSGLFLPGAEFVGKLPERVEGLPTRGWAAKFESLLRKTEKVMGRWSMVGLFYLVLCLVLLFWGGR